MIHNHFDKAKRFARRVMSLSAIALLPFMTACCDYEDELPAEDMVPLSFYLQTAGSQQTRAYIGDLEAETAEESKINDVKVWIYQDGVCVAYATDIDASNKVTTSVAQSVLTSSVDVYIIANAKSAGLDGLNGSTSLNDLTKATIDVSKFSAADPVTAVPTDGLPMSMIKKGCDINADNIPATLETINITRAVSKIYFAFGMYTGDFGEIVSISLESDEDEDGEEDGQIAKSEYIMPVAPTGEAGDLNYSGKYLGDRVANIKTDDGYEKVAITFQGSGDAPLYATSAIYQTAVTQDPADFIWEDWSVAYTGDADEIANNYYAAIAPFVNQKIYLRESDKKLKGTISYRFRIPTVVDGEETEIVTETKTATFEMDAESMVQDFARNHVWIVYAYFEGGKLYVKPTVAPWIDATTTNYAMKLSSNMRLFDSWLYRYDLDEKDFLADDPDWTGHKYWETWTESHMVVSSGTLPDENATGDRPAKSPLIQLVTTTGTETGEAINLKLDNNKFKLIRAVKDDTGRVTEYEDCGQTLSITAGENIYTYFYVVPADGTEEGATAKVTLIYTNPVVGDQKVPFNSNSLPGYSDDSSEIWVYCVAPDDYSNTAPSTYAGKLLKMYYQDASHPIVPTVNQS